MSYYCASSSTASREPIPAPVFAQSGLSRLLFVWPEGLCISHFAQTTQPQWAIRPDINKSERLETNAGLWLDGMVMTWLGSNLSIDEQIVLFKGTTEREGKLKHVHRRVCMAMWGLTSTYLCWWVIWMTLKESFNLLKAFCISVSLFRLLPFFLLRVALKQPPPAGASERVCELWLLPLCSPTTSFMN